MTYSPKLILVVCTLAGTAMYLGISQERKTSMNVLQALQMLKDVVGTRLGLPETQCLSEDSYPYRICYGLKGTPEDFIAKFEGSLRDIAIRTMGWRQDYSVWVAMYDFKTTRNVNLGVSIAPKAPNPELRRLDSMAIYDALVTIVVDSPQQPKYESFRVEDKFGGLE
ncbi:MULTISPECIES: hypothetical protein [Calidithermus]|uniref:Uncharacterized protein n=1 Tax=Calidithermus roseus TaxID=1644118 RepID=A0A399EU32_9DEIN|nr:MULTISPECIES: hypothetical protein [Calidithermus]RIH86122.1 hypothetical protein Mrose_01896 [Calidithermus roseus]